MNILFSIIVLLFGIVFIWFQYKIRIKRQDRDSYDKFTNIQGYYAGALIILIAFLFMFEVVDIRDLF